MVLVAEYDYIRSQAKELVVAGFGYSTLGEPKSEDFDSADPVEMLRDWGWSGKGQAPAWLDAT
jgi:hypothetical protein